MLSALWAALLAPAFTALGSPITWLELVAFVLSVWMVVCNMRVNPLAWPLALVASLMYFALFLDGKLYGEAGLDRLYGYDGNDWLEGNSSNDRLEGGAGLDTMLGQKGDDHFFAKDGEIDQLFGGDNTDDARVDAGDVLATLETLV